MWSSRHRPSAVWRLLAAGGLAGLVALAATPGEEPSSPPEPSDPIPRVTLTLQETGAADETGRVILEVVPSESDDPDDSVRLQAVLVGPLKGKGGNDVFAFTAGLRFPADRLEYLPETLRKGALLESDGKTSLITGGASPGEQTRVTIGASRLGTVPGVKVPAGRSVLFSAAFRIVEAGDAVLAWEEASLIDSNIKPVEGARFVAATLHVERTEN